MNIFESSYKFSLLKQLVYSLYFSAGPFQDVLYHLFYKPEKLEVKICQYRMGLNIKGINKF